MRRFSIRNIFVGTICAALCSSGFAARTMSQLAYSLLRLPTGERIEIQGLTLSIATMGLAEYALRPYK